MVIQLCKWCKKTFKTYPAEIKKGGGKFCSKYCTYEARKGSLSPLWTKRVEVKCLHCSKPFSTRPSRISQGRGRYCSQVCRSIATITGRVHSEETKKKLSEMRKGKLNPAYKDGRSYTLTHYESTFPKLLRDKVKERDHYKCQKCGNNKDLNVHHKDMNQTNASIANLITYCRSCHSRLHRIYEYSNGYR